METLRRLVICHLLNGNCADPIHDLVCELGYEKIAKNHYPCFSGHFFGYKYYTTNLKQQPLYCIITKAAILRNESLLKNKHESYNYGSYLILDILRSEGIEHDWLTGKCFFKDIK